MFFLQIILNSIVSGTQILLISAPLYLIYSVSKTFHLGIGAVSTAVAYIFYMVFIKSESMLISISAGFLASMLFGAISYLLLERYIQKKQALFAMLVSFSFGVALEASIAIIFGADGKSITGKTLPVFNFFGLHLTFPGLLTIILGIIFFISLAFVLKKTPYGRLLRSLAENSEVSQSLGTSSKKTRFVVYLAAILLAGFIGIMSGINTALTPNMGFGIVILGFIAFLIGGTTNIVGTFTASYVIAFIPQLIVSYSNFSSAWKMVFVFLIAAILLSIKPKGLFYSSSRNS